MSGGLRLAVDISERRAPDGKVEEAASSYPVRLRWTEDVVSFDDPSGRCVELDFRKKEQRTIDEQARTVTTKPLQACVSFRDVEVHNRVHIDHVLKAGGSAELGFGALHSEHQLSVVLPGDKSTIGKRSFLSRFFGKPPDIELLDQESQLAMVAGPRLLMTSSLESINRPEAVAPLAHFLRNAFGGHPLILQRLVDGKQVPRSIMLGCLHPLAEGGNVTVGVSEAELAPAASTAEFEQLLPLDGSQQIDPVLRSDAWKGPAPEGGFSEAKTLLQGPAPVMGLLAMFEVTLANGAPMPADVAALIKASTDVHLQSLLTLLMSQSQSAEEAQARLNGFSFLRLQAGRYAYLLGAFEAPVHRALNQNAKAMEVLSQVLLTNPRVTGAWKDLGDLFAHSLDFTRAWFCWNRARAIAPDHPLLKDVASYEERLEISHPQYFSLR